ncbi:Hypothetical_protein [Hexamita inflata]|uniref:Hypothetical_protein n=1 Tax=Hexamita inflata TaxID=28002 RepID=A0AA86R604_9EUKA|nr:Hypothetical protein HINF_LOCUS58835 [Hexamita inflata]
MNLGDLSKVYQTDIYDISPVTVNQINQNQQDLSMKLQEIYNKKAINTGISKCQNGIETSKQNKLGIYKQIYSKSTQCDEPAQCAQVQSTELQLQIIEHQSEIQDYKILVQQLQNEITTVKQQKVILQQSYQQQQKSINNEVKPDSVIIPRQDLINLTKDQAVHKKQIIDLQKQVKSLEQQLSLEVNKQEIIKIELNKKKELQLTTSNYCEYTPQSLNQFVQTEDCFTDLMNQINDSEKTINEGKITILNQNEQLKQMNETVKQKDAEITSLQSQVTKSKDELTICTHIKNQLEADIQNLKQTFGEVKKQHQKEVERLSNSERNLFSQNEKLKTELKGIQIQCSTATNERNALEKELQATKQVLNDTLNTNKQQQQQIETQTLKIEEVENNIKQKQIENKYLIEQKELLTKENTTLKDLKQTHEIKIKELTHSNHHQKCEIECLQHQTKLLTDENTTLQQEQQNIITVYNTLQDELLSQKDEQIKLLQAQLQEKEQEIVLIEEFYKQNEMTLKAQKDQIAENEEIDQYQNIVTQCQLQSQQQQEQQNNLLSVILQEVRSIKTNRSQLDLNTLTNSQYQLESEQQILQLFDSQIERQHVNILKQSTNTVQFNELSNVEYTDDQKLE